MNAVNNLREYAKKVFDTNKDGIVDIKDFFRLFPSQAIAITVIFIDVVILASEYRVWDVGFQITNDPYKAVGFVLVSAVPFLLGQILWLYPLGNWIQKRIGEVFVISSLYIGYLFGTADLSKNYDVDFLISIVVQATFGYVVLSLIYVLVDDKIKAWRLQRQIMAQSEQEGFILELTRKSLLDIRKTAQLKKEIEEEFEDSELVKDQLSRFRGRKTERPN